MANEHISTDAHRHPKLAPKRIKHIRPSIYGHIHLTFEDDSMDVIRREELEGAVLSVGDYWPPRPPEPVAARLVRPTKPLPPRTERVPIPVEDHASEK
jgi:hypothetical protein